jgi:hypothetical protein
MSNGFWKEKVPVSNRSPSWHLGHLKFSILYSLLPFFAMAMIAVDFG